MIQHMSLASLTGYTEVETLPGVSYLLCHAEPQDAENVKKILLISSFYSIVLVPIMCPLSYIFFLL